MFRVIVWRTYPLWSEPHITRRLADLSVPFLFIRAKNTSLDFGWLIFKTTLGSSRRVHRFSREWTEHCSLPPRCVNHDRLDVFLRFRINFRKTFKWEKANSAEMIDRAKKWLIRMIARGYPFVLQVRFRFGCDSLARRRWLFRHEKIVDFDGLMAD